MTFRRANLCFFALAVLGIHPFVTSAFASGGRDGVNGSELGSGTRGGNAGVLNISVTGLFNTTNARFIGRGGFSTLSATAGGNGGVLQLNYHGLIRNFSDGEYDGETDNSFNLTGGRSTGGTNGTAGTAIYNRDSVCPRDPDTDNDGSITIFDQGNIQQKYNNVTSDSTFVASYDINCDGRINVIDLAQIGFVWGTREAP